MGLSWLPGTRPACGTHAKVPLAKTRSTIIVAETQFKSGIPFVDPETGHPLTHRDGALVGERSMYPVVDGIPRFVASEGYTAAFGLEWNLHAATQLDSRNGTTISRDRLIQTIGVPLAELESLSCLEPGCGAGRFTEHLVASGATVYAFDMSTSVDSVRRSLGSPDNLILCQADVTRPPFPAESFDVVACLGVLQYTPSPDETLRSLWRMVKPGGLLAVDQYRSEFRRWLKVDTLLRPLMTRLKPKTARRVTEAMVQRLFPLHWAARNSLPARAVLTRFSPVYCYAATLPTLSREQHFDWSMLDTYNHLTGPYQKTTTVDELQRRLVALGGSDVTVFPGGNGVIGRARKPAAGESNVAGS